jgi:hypothetical protein
MFRQTGRRLRNFVRRPFSTCSRREKLRQPPEWTLRQGQLEGNSLRRESAPRDKSQFLNSDRNYTKTLIVLVKKRTNSVSRREDNTFPNLYCGTFPYKRYCIDSYDHVRENLASLNEFGLDDAPHVGAQLKLERTDAPIRFISAR